MAPEPAGRRPPARDRSAAEVRSAPVRAAATAGASTAVELSTVRGVMRSAARAGPWAGRSSRWATLVAAPAPSPATTIAATAASLAPPAAAWSETQRQLARPRVAAASAAAAQQQREREQRGDLLDRALAQRLAGDERGVHAGHERLAAARLAVGDVARQAARVARAEAAA